jgi:hypothetical protein
LKGAEILRIALSSYEPRIITKVDLLLSRIEGFKGEPVDITEYAMFFGFDVMGEVGKCNSYSILMAWTIDSPVNAG